MAKRYVKIRKRKIRLDRLLAGVLVLVARGAALIFGVSSCRRNEAPAETADAGWYRDDLGLIEDDRALVEGMEAFEKRIGVRPFLALLEGVDPEELDVFTEDLYDALFDHGGRLLAVYDEWEEDVYYLSAWAGEASSLSRESVDAVLACLEDAYADPANGSYAQAFGSGFARGAEAVSSRVSAGAGAGLFVVLGLLLLILAAALALILRRRFRAAARRGRGRSAADEG